MRRVILHAGLPKTGSTSIQRFLDVNSEALREQGFMYEPAPDRPGRRDHNFLAMAFWPRVQRIYTDRYGSDIERLRGDSLAAWHAQLGAFRASDQQTLVISAEMLTRCKVPSLSDFVRQEMSDLDLLVLFYLRQPSDLYVSWLQQHLKGSNDLLPFSRERGRWAKRLRLFQKHVGSVELREFDRATMRGADVVTDFVDAIGIDPAGLVRPANANESVSAEGMALILRHRRRHFPQAPNKMLPETLALVREIQRAESRLTRVDFTSPTLRPDLAGYLDSDVDELNRLERQFGFRYARIGDPSRLSGASSDLALEGRTFAALEEIMSLDQHAMERLRSHLERRGHTF